MFKPFGTVFFAASVLAAALALPATLHAKDGAVTVAAAEVSSPTATAREALATPAPKVKRVRKPLRRVVATVAPPDAYHPQCFLFWCTANGRSFNILMLGVAY